jgi:RNA polymerase sigma-70 factor (ECF subfamily)
MNVSIESVWETFNTPLEKFVRRRLPDRQTADDVLQEVYLKIHGHLDGVRDEERLSAWVYQVARNTITDYYRAQKPIVEMDEAIPDEPADANEAFAAQLAASVRRMADALPEPYREALLLAEYEGLTQREVAERLGISLSGAKSRVQRGRKLLREMLLACCHFEFDRLGRVIDYYPRCACCSGDECAS